MAFVRLTQDVRAGPGFDKLELDGETSDPKSKEYALLLSDTVVVGATVGSGETVGMDVVGADVGARQAPPNAYRLATSSASSARLQICIDLIAPSK